MQKKVPIDKEISISEMNSLIKSIKELNPKATEGELSKLAGYGEQGITQAKSRGASVGLLNGLRVQLLTLQNVGSNGGGKGSPAADGGQPEEEKENIRNLSLALKNLSEDKVRTIALMERMFSYIERTANYVQGAKADATQQANNAQGDDHFFEDAELDKRVMKADKGSHRE